MFSIPVFLESFGPLIWAARNTLLISVLGIGLGLVIGTLICAARLSPYGALRGFAALWVSFLRGVPLLVQLLVFYYTLPVIGIDVPATVAAIVTVGICASAYISEIWRGAIAALPKGQAEAAIAAHGARVQCVCTIGATGLSAAQMQRMPGLALVCAMGAGYENIDVAYAKAHGIAVGNGVGTNDDCVADHAMGLLIAAVRGIVKLDKATRAGIWRSALPLPANVSGKRLGIVGLGQIGAKIARRAAAFDMPVGYHNRKPREGVDYRYFDDLLALAAWADVLLVATPGGAGTRHLINAEEIGRAHV